MKYASPGMYAKCPFYRRESRFSVCCEGIGEGTEFSIKFQTEEDKKQYIRAHCNQMKSGCELRIALQKKYR